MTIYTLINDTEIAQDKPLKAEIGLALRDNALAIQEGDATAPSIYVALANKLVAGGLGSLAWAYHVPGDIGYGGTAAGSNLRTTGAARAYTMPWASEADLTPALAVGGALAGTWKCLGHMDVSAAVSETHQPSGGGPFITKTAVIYGATLWQRIV